MDFTNSGIEALGDIHWGTHFCNFYHNHEDLIDTLVPFFKAGLENNEKCLWVTSQPLMAYEARSLLAAVVSDLAVYEKKGQIEIVDHKDWYQRSGSLDADDTLRMWVARQELALEQGYKGLRLTGNTYWLERNDWAGFQDYERKVNETFSKHRIVGLCSYCMDRTTSSDVFNVVRNHDFALLRQDGEWELIETAGAKQTKNQLQQLNQELKSNLRQARDAAESANRLKSEFLANMSHEIRTPLGSILGFSELLKEPDLNDDERSEFLDAIIRNGRSLSQLIEDILDISKVDADRLELETYPFHLVGLIHDVTSLFANQLQAKSLALQLDFAPGAPNHIISNAARIRQILVKLLANAIKFTSAGQIILSVDHNGDLPSPQLRFRVKDTGIGISKELAPHLFQVFSQIDGSLSRKFGGTGLGLFLCRKLARAMNGDVFLEESAPGQGSSFVLQLPVGIAQTCDHHSPSNESQVHVQGLTP